jgi:hypothetical protein
VPHALTRQEGHAADDAHEVLACQAAAGSAFVVPLPWARTRAASSNTPLIDLQTMALAYYTKIGLTAVQTTIVLVSGGQPNVLHFQKQGAYEMARLVALGVQALNLPISQFVVQAKLDGG